MANGYEISKFAPNQKPTVKLIYKKTKGYSGRAKGGMLSFLRRLLGER
jgi:nucleoid-associated protein YejK